MYIVHEIYLHVIQGIRIRICSLLNSKKEKFKLFIYRILLMGQRIRSCLSGVAIIDGGIGETVMELELQWDGNPSIIIDIETRVGVKLPIQVLFILCVNWIYFIHDQTNRKLLINIIIFCFFVPFFFCFTFVQE